jgi:neutral ceramidase
MIGTQLDEARTDGRRTLHPQRGARESGRSQLLGALLACLLALQSGCAVVSGKLVPPAPPKATGVFRAGAAKADITPFPGFPTGGHGSGGKIARGWWTRLRARAVYLEGPSGKAIAMVACDLWSLPGGLSDRVAEILGTWEDTQHLGREQVLLAATHTHHSPGNFSTSSGYNAFASCRMGFDRRLFEFLATRIANAIREACAAKAPARLRVEERPVELLCRNRSLEPFLRDEEAGEVLHRNEGLSLGPVMPEYPDERCDRAVDPALTLVTVERADPWLAPIALLGFVAVHCTAIGHDLELYSGDLFAVAATEVETELRRRSPGEPTPLVAIFNGPEGDVSPAWQNQDRRNLLILGGRLSRAILDLAGKGPDVTGDVDYRFRAEAAVSGVKFLDRTGNVRRTAKEALPGWAMPGGAEDGRTAAYRKGHVEGVTGPDLGDDQGPKKPPYPRWVIGLLDFLYLDIPETVPLGVYRVGSLVFATLPGEFTTVMGLRVRRALAEEGGLEPRRVIGVGLAGEYLSYFATPEEYALQHYEGASTLYGTFSGELILRDLRTLASTLARPGEPPAERRFRYAAGLATTFTVEDTVASVTDPDPILTEVLQELLTGEPVRSVEIGLGDDAPSAWAAGEHHRPRFPRFCWEDEATSMPSHPQPKERIIPQVAVELVAASGDGRPLPEEDDEGLHLVTLILSAHEAAPRWCSIWMPPAGTDENAQYRFHVVGVDGVGRRSPVFRLDPSVGALSATPPSVARIDRGHPLKTFVGSLPLGVSSR